MSSADPEKGTFAYSLHGIIIVADHLSIYTRQWYEQSALVFFESLQLGLALLSAFEVGMRSSDRPSHGVESETVGLGRKLE